MKSFDEKLDEEVENFGHRSIIKFQTQTWASFTGILFGGEKLRREFDRLCFVFGEKIPEDLKSRSDEKGMEREIKYSKGVIKVQVDDLSDSLESAYFGRTIRCTTCLLPPPSVDTAKAMLTSISEILLEVYPAESQKFSTPLLVICDTEVIDKAIVIHACYLWEYRELSDE